MWGLASLAGVAIVVVSATLALGSSTRDVGAAACDIPEPDRTAVQSALNIWPRVRAEALEIASPSLPWLVLFDERCVWHVAPRWILNSPGIEISTIGVSIDGVPIRISGHPHFGKFSLPDMRSIGTRATAFTSVVHDLPATFSVVSMPGVWRRDPRHAKDRRLDEFFQGLVIHELTHSTQLRGVTDRIAELRRQHPMPGVVDDDVVQRRFGAAPAFQKAIEAERDVFYRAALAVDPARRRALAVKGLSMTRQRRTRFYMGQSAVFGELEDLFFAMEGSAQWAVYQASRWRAQPGVAPDAIVDFVRADRQYWSQDEGLALYLLIDALVPDWQQRTFRDTMASPFALLEDALR